MNASTPKSPQGHGLIGSAFNVFLGLWLILAPFLLIYGQSKVAAWNDVIVGIVVCVSAVTRATGDDNHPGWSWCNMLLGLWLLISPFALGFAGNPTAKWNNIILGVVIAILSWISAKTIWPRKAG